MNFQSQNLKSEIARVFVDAFANDNESVHEFFCDYFFEAKCWSGFALILSETSGCLCREDQGAELAGIIIDSPQLLEAAFVKEASVIEAARKENAIDPNNPIPGSIKAILESRKLQFAQH